MGLRLAIGLGLGFSRARARVKVRVRVRVRLRVRLRLRLRLRLRASSCPLRALPAGYLYTQPYRPTPNQAKTWDDVVEALTSNTPERTNEVCLLPPSVAWCGPSAA